MSDKSDKTWKPSVTGLISVVVLVGGFIGIDQYLGSEYARASTVKSVQDVVAIHEEKIQKIAPIELEMAGVQKQLQEFQTDLDRERLIGQIESTDDKIYELERRIRRDGENAREEDRQQLNKMENRLRRYEQKLEVLEGQIH